MFAAWFRAKILRRTAQTPPQCYAFVDDLFVISEHTDTHAYGIACNVKTSTGESALMMIELRRETDRQALPIGKIVHITFRASDPQLPDHSIHLVKRKAPAA